MGLGEGELRALASDTESIFHCAASTSLGQPIELAREANVGSTERVLRLARLAQESSNLTVEFFHVSTAYVAGDTSAIVTPEELRVGATFRNGYEQSKAEAEQLVRSHADELHTCIFRPSMIVGDSITGQTNAFNVIYIPARYLASGLLSFLPAHPNTPCDLVPVDYVADAMVALSAQKPDSGSCFHISAGVGREAAISEIVEFIIKIFNQYRRRGLEMLPLPSFIPPDRSVIGMKQIESGVTAGIRVFKEMFHLFPYMVKNPQFDTSKTFKALDGQLAQPPLFSEYGEKVFEYCAQTNWGKRAWSNPAAYQNWWSRMPAV
jgi:long-chain acyl-CoA synthetase